MVLLVMLLPCLGRWVSGRAGLVRGADIAVLLFCLWYGVSFAATEGLSAAVEPAGINMIEVAGAYFLARCYIRNHDDFCRMIHSLFMIMLVLLPFAVVESFTGRNIIAEFFGQFLNADAAVTGGGTRWGLRRANSVFDHPIMFGVAAATLLPLAHLVLGGNSSALRRWVRDSVIVCLTFLSLSSAPIGLTALLITLIAWDTLLRSFPFRWHVVAVAFASAYFAVDILSNQTPVEFYIHRFTFEGQTGWYRLLIWDYGTASVAANPLFGIGLDEWARPAWMVSSSIDSFWLVQFVRTGVPGGVLMLAIFGLAALASVRVTPATEGVRMCQTAYLLSLFGLFFTGATVHFWGAGLVLFLFIVGSGMWIAETGRGKPEGTRWPLSHTPREVCSELSSERHRVHGSVRDLRQRTPNQGSGSAEET
ncbi:hypothetical protein [uncultured Paracoccus sp.]|uniref:O-antigen ligase family protein n=1 Tax=uncultured Paracoccus sp. TaxID=189685 RepID=UPI002616A940|nr:hypothetical protein [uncultured Paracoccus sp.]